jgi:predicted GH43/DUF377 family glycosyl hydrolase
MLDRMLENPIITPDKDQAWEAYAAFNPCVVESDNKFHLLYRAMSVPSYVQDVHMSISSIGYAISDNGIHFNKINQFIKPEHGWEAFGCEDPRVTKLGKKFYIFYTALSSYPFSPGGIKIGLVMTEDFKKIESKHPVTTFNSKAMALFPEKINGKFAAVLTVHTDIPPSKIALALFDKEEDMWSEQYWNEWYSSLNHHIIPLLRSSNDHIEVGAPPVKTKYGWLLIYSYIQDYFSSKKIFSIEVALLDLNNPLKVIGKTSDAMLIPEKTYEINGNVPNVIFPSGAFLRKDKLYVYYGAADTSCCVATYSLKDLLDKLINTKASFFIPSEIEKAFNRYSLNPIISPRPEFLWEAKATFNPAAIYEAGKVHIIYRAMSNDDTSVWGYASSEDGFHIDERLPEPIYKPNEIFEQKLKAGGSGCEDPRITKIDDRLYAFYTAFDGFSPRVAFTTILLSDFLNKWWNWERPKVITSPSVPDKDACLLPRKINNKYVIFHRINTDIYLDYLDDLSFSREQWLINKYPIIKINCDDKYHFLRVGISAPPIETEYGWLLLYHWIIAFEGANHYRVGVALLDLNNPERVISKDVLLLKPEMDYEKIGIVPNVVFPCGAVLLNNEVVIYYGGADKVVAVAKMTLSDILKKLKV